MRTWTIPLLVALVAAMGAAPATSPSSTVRFGYVDVFIDTGARPLAAYQFELQATAGDATVVGIERGDAKGFTDPPYYDPAALSGGKIIIAAFNTGTDLPSGKTRVARIHMQLKGDQKAQYAIRLMAAGSTDGSAISATTAITEGEAR